MTGKKRFASIYIHPYDKVMTLELGKINASDMMYRFDEIKKDFIEIGYPQLIKIIKLPKSMDIYEATKFINQDKEITKIFEDYCNGK